MHPTMITAILRFTQMILVTIYLGDMGGGGWRQTLLLRVSINGKLTWRDMHPSAVW